MIYSYVAELSRLLYVNVVAYDYSGYGLGTRRKDNVENGVQPSEENCYADIDAVYEYLTTMRGVNPKQIVLYGRSVGSGPSCYLAQKLGKNGIELGGMILHSPFLSVCRVVVDVGIENPLDLFPNVSRAKDFICPTFIIHGTKDGVVPFYHGKGLYQRLNEKVRYEPYWAESMGHNNIESDQCAMFIKRLQRFFLHVIKIQAPDALQHKLTTKKLLAKAKKVTQISSIDNLSRNACPEDGDIKLEALFPRSRTVAVRVKRKGGATNGSKQTTRDEIAIQKTRRSTKRRIADGPIAIIFNSTREEEDEINGRPHIKISRTDSPTNVVENLEGDAPSPIFSAVEFGEIECCMVPELVVT